MILVVLGVAVFSGLMAWRHSAKIVVPLTIIFGSYMLVRGVSILIDGGVPTGFNIFGQSSTVLGTFYYLVGYAFSMGLGYAFQKHNNLIDLHQESCESDHEEESEEGEGEEEEHEKKPAHKADDTMTTHETSFNNP